jgi:hypothetical protein
MVDVRECGAVGIGTTTRPDDTTPVGRGTRAHEQQPWHRGGGEHSASVKEVSKGSGYR